MSFSDKLKSLWRKIKAIFVPEDIKTDQGTIITPPKPSAPYLIILFLIVYIISSISVDFSYWTIIKKIFNFQDSRGNWVWFIGSDGSFELFYSLGPIGFIRRFFPVDWEFYSQVWQPIIETIQMSFLGSLIGSAFALPAAYLASQNLVKSRVVTSVVRVLLSIVRTVPIVIYAVFFKLIFGLGALAGTVAIIVFTFGIVAKMLYERIETLDMGAYEAVESTGATKPQAFLTALMPNIAPIFYSNSLYAFEINIRYAAILGYVGAGGIGWTLNDALTNVNNNDRTIVILVFIFVTVLAIETLSRALRRRFS